MYVKKNDIYFEIILLNFTTLWEGKKQNEWTRKQIFILPF